MNLFNNIIIEHTPKGYKWSVNTTRCPKYYSTFEECQAEGMHWSKNYEPLTIEEADDRAVISMTPEGSLEVTYA